MFYLLTYVMQDMTLLVTRSDDHTCSTLHFIPL